MLCYNIIGGDKDLEKKITVEQMHIEGERFISQE